MTKAHLAIASSSQLYAAHSAIDACVNAAIRGELFNHLDSRLLSFIQTNVQGTPLGAAVSTPDGLRGILIEGTARLITARTSIDAIWLAKSGSTARAYGSSAGSTAETWGNQIEDAMFGWVSSWITSIVRRSSHAVRVDVRDRAYEAMHETGATEWEWERSRRSMTFGELRDSARALLH